MKEINEIFSPETQNGLRVILNQAGFQEHTDFFFTNGLCFFNKNTQILQMDAIAEYLKKFEDEEGEEE
ncbi:MAG: hypothetical protein KME22_06575 [Hassallia sp. WJT32-NPBG1]|jgi:hypothetical protein|nr:hypothetical protein [Hassallia sp. WJT32-NPBG1]